MKVRFYGEKSSIITGVIIREFICNGTTSFLCYDENDFAQTYLIAVDNIIEFLEYIEPKSNLDSKYKELIQEIKKLDKEALKESKKENIPINILISINYIYSLVKDLE